MDTGQLQRWTVEKQCYGVNRTPCRLDHSTYAPVFPFPGKLLLVFPLKWSASSVPHQSHFLGWILLCISKFLLAWRWTIEKLFVMISCLMCITEKSLNSWDQWWNNTWFQICLSFFLYGNFLRFFLQKDLSSIIHTKTYNLLGLKSKAKMLN